MCLLCPTLSGHLHWGLPLPPFSLPPAHHSIHPHATDGHPWTERCWGHTLPAAGAAGGPKRSGGQGALPAADCRLWKGRLDGADQLVDPHDDGHKIDGCRILMSQALLFFTICFPSTGLVIVDLNECDVLLEVVQVFPRRRLAYVCLSKQLLFFSPFFGQKTLFFFLFRYTHVKSLVLFYLFSSSFCFEELVRSIAKMLWPAKSPVV